MTIRTANTMKKKKKFLTGKLTVSFTSTRCKRVFLLYWKPVTRLRRRCQAVTCEDDNIQEQGHNHQQSCIYFNSTLPRSTKMHAVETHSKVVPDVRSDVGAFGS